MLKSYLFRFRNDNNEKDFELEMWRIKNFIKTHTSRTLKSTEFGDTCFLISKIRKEECGAD